MSKLKVHIFDTVIYPRKVYVVKGKDIQDDILNAFSAQDGFKLDTNGADGCRAGCWRVQLNEDKKLGVLVWLREKIDVSVIAHESVHAANTIFGDCGVTYTPYNDEHFAHLVGFIADCVYQTWTGKFKED